MCVLAPTHHPHHDGGSTGEVLMQRDAALMPASIGRTFTRTMQTSSSKTGTTWIRSFQSWHRILITYLRCAVVPAYPDGTADGQL